MEPFDLETTSSVSYILQNILDFELIHGYLCFIYVSKFIYIYVSEYRLCMLVNIDEGWRYQNIFYRGTEGLGIYSIEIIGRILWSKLMGSEVSSLGLHVHIYKL